MTSSAPIKPRAIPSWWGLGFGLLAAGLNIAAFAESQALHNLVAALAFLVFAYPWSQLASFRKPSPLSRAATVLTYAGLALLLVSLLLRFM